MTPTVTALQKHKQTTCHAGRDKALHDPIINSMLRNIEGDDLVQDAEKWMAAFIIKHNLSFNIMDHLSELLPKVFPDSEIAQQFKSMHSKTSKVIDR